MPSSRPGPSPAADPRPRQAPRRRVAAIVAVALGIGSLLAGVTPIGVAGAAVTAAQVSVSTTTAIDPAGETLTVTGTGFDPAAHVGARPPLAGQPSGVYVVFGRFGDPWKPSAGAPSASREIIAQQWALPAAQKAMLDPTGTDPELILLAPDGSFTAQIHVAPGGTTAGRYAIAVYPGSGAVDAGQEVLTPIAFGDPEPSWEPAITVSKTAGIADAGETVTVTGSGFDPAANVGTRPPLSGQATGIYVVYGRFGDPWRPSSGAPSTARESLGQVWVLPAASRAVLDPGGTNPSFATLAADGTFSVDLTVAPGGTSAGAFGIATYAAGGAVNADHELLTPLSFASAPPSWDPQVSVSKTDGLDAAGETVTVTGAGFDPAANVGTHPPLTGQPSGVYVAFGRYADVWAPSAGAPATDREGLSVVWVVPAASRAVLDPTGTAPGFATLAADGTFSVELAAAPGGTTTGKYAVVTYAGGGAVNADHETRTDLTFASTPPPSTPGTGTGANGQSVTVTPYSALDPDGQDLVVDGAGFDPGVGIYVALCVDQGPNLPPSPCVGGSGEQSGSSSSAWITDDDRFASLRTAPFGPGGTFSATIHVTAADELVDCYDTDTTCVLATRADHTATADRSADVKVPVFFEGQTPVTPEPDPTPSAAVLDRTTVEAGGQLTVSGEGFVPGEQVQVWLHSEPQLMGVTVADALGAVRFAFTVPTTTEPGTHHVELHGITSALRLISPDFSVVAAAVPVAATASTTPAAADPTATATGTLPVTGSGLALPLAGLALLALGAVLATPTLRPRGAVVAVATPSSATPSSTTTRGSATPSSTTPPSTTRSTPPSTTRSTRRATGRSTSTWEPRP